MITAYLVAMPFELKDTEVKNLNLQLTLCSGLMLKVHESV